MWRQDVSQNRILSGLKPAARWDFFALIQAMRLSGVRDYRWLAPVRTIAGVLDNSRSDVLARRLAVLEGSGLVATLQEAHMMTLEVCNPADFLKLTPAELQAVGARTPLTETEKKKEKEQSKTETETAIPARPLRHRLLIATQEAIEMGKAEGIEEDAIERAAAARLRCGMDASSQDLLVEAARLHEVS